MGSTLPHALRGSVCTALGLLNHWFESCFMISWLRRRRHLLVKPVALLDQVFPLKQICQNVSGSSTNCGRLCNNRFGTQWAISNLRCQWFCSYVGWGATTFLRAQLCCVICGGYITIQTTGRNLTTSDQVQIYIHPLHRILLHQLGFLSW